MALIIEYPPGAAPRNQIKVKSREKPTDAWIRPLNGGRVEIMCCTPGFRIRVTAPEDEAWEAVEMFEKWTGLTIRADRRPKRKQSVPAGQLSMTEL